VSRPNPLAGVDNVEDAVVGAERLFAAYRREGTRVEVELVTVARRDAQGQSSATSDSSAT
jgi:hypothetical protein